MAIFLCNAKIYQGNSRFAQAALIQNGRFAAVGQQADLRKRAEGAETVDCGGRTVIPGLNDAFSCLLAAFPAVPVKDCRSVEALVQACRFWLDAHPKEARRGLHVCMSLRQITEGKPLPQLADLNLISQAAPVVLEDVMERTAVCNGVAVDRLKAAGVPARFSGLFDCLPDGTFTGCVHGDACRLAAALVSPPPASQLRKTLEQAMRMAAAQGVTSVQGIDIGVTLPQTEALFALLRQMEEEGTIPLRYHQTLDIPQPLPAKLRVPGKWRDYPLNGWLTRGGLLAELDASLCPSAGKQEIDLDQLYAATQASGQQVLTRASGSAALNKVVACWRGILTEGHNPLRCGIVGGQCTDPRLLQELVRAKLPVVALPGRLIGDLMDAERSPDCAPAACCAFRTMGQLGIRLAFGLGDDCSPFRAMAQAVLRRDEAGFPENGFFPKECMTVSDALDAFTTQSAYLQFQEDVKGRIRPGYYADLAVLDRDIFTCAPAQLGETQVVMTMVGGEIVFRQI